MSKKKIASGQAAKKRVKAAMKVRHAAQAIQRQADRKERKEEWTKRHMKKLLEKQRLEKQDAKKAA